VISTRLLLWAAAAGALIPVMAVLNSRLGKAIGEGLHAPVVLFSIGLLFCLIVSWITTKSFPNLQEFGSIKPIEYLGGIIVGFYVISATLLAPRIGVE
jgi:transporter family-2 protein